MKLIEAFEQFPPDTILCGAKYKNKSQSVTDWLHLLPAKELNQWGFGIYSTPTTEGKYFTSIASTLTIGAQFSGTTDENLTTEE